MINDALGQALKLINTFVDAYIDSKKKKAEIRKVLKEIEKEHSNLIEKDMESRDSYLELFKKNTLH